MNDKKGSERKPYSKPRLRKLRPFQVLHRLTELATSHGKDLLSLLGKHKEVYEGEVQNGRWIGVDLDGTLAEYDGWKGMEHIGKPVPAMEARVRKWLSVGRTVKIVTARVSQQAEDEKPLAEAAIRHWTKEHFGCELEATAEKDFDMMVLYDDRAVCVRTNQGTALRWQGTGDFEADMVVPPPIDMRVPSEEGKEPKE